MKVGRLAPQLKYCLIGVLVLTSFRPSHARAQDARMHTVTSQHHEPAADQKSQASELVRVVRESTERFRDVSVAEAEGYVLKFG